MKNDRRQPGPGKKRFALVFAIIVVLSSSPCIASNLGTGAFTLAALDFGVSPFQLFALSDMVGRLITIILFAGSILAWTIMVDRYLEIRDVLRAYQLLNTASGNSPEKLLQYVRNYTPTTPSTPLDIIVQTIAEELQNMEAIAPEPAVFQSHFQKLQVRTERALDQLMLSLENRMGILGSIITASPFLGLLGTVWGVMSAFARMALHNATSASRIQVMAPGIASALLTTVVGLLVAIPAVIGFNYLSDQLRQLTLQLEGTIASILAEIQLQHTPAMNQSQPQQENQTGNHAQE